MRPETAARLALGSVTAFVALGILVHLVTPELDPALHPISEYALGPRGSIMTLVFLAWGASAASVSVALRPHVPTRGGRIGRVFLLIGASGPLLAAIFPMDPMGTPADAATLSGHLHNTAAMLGDGIPIGALLITQSLFRKNPAWAGAKWPLVVTTILTWTGVVVMTVMLARMMAEGQGQFGPHVAMGWPPRLMILASMAWIVVAARSAARLGERIGS